MCAAKRLQLNASKMSGGHVVWYHHWSPQASGWQQMYICRCRDCGAFRVNSRKLNALQLLEVSLKHFYSHQRIFKTDYVMHLWSTSRRCTKLHHVVMLCYVVAH